MTRPRDIRNAQPISLATRNMLASLLDANRTGVLAQRGWTQEAIYTAACDLRDEAPDPRIQNLLNTDNPGTPETPPDTPDNPNITVPLHDLQHILRSAQHALDCIICNRLRALTTAHTPHDFPPPVVVPTGDDRAHDPGTLCSDACFEPPRPTYCCSNCGGDHPFLECPSRVPETS